MENIDLDVKSYFNLLIIIRLGK